MLCVRSRSDTFTFTINGKSLKAKVREQPDSSLYVSLGVAVGYASRE